MQRVVVAFLVGLWVGLIPALIVVVPPRTSEPLFEEDFLRTLRATHASLGREIRYLEGSRRRQPRRVVRAVSHRLRQRVVSVVVSERILPTVHLAPSSGPDHDIGLVVADARTVPVSVSGPVPRSVSSPDTELSSSVVPEPSGPRPSTPPASQSALGKSDKGLYAHALQLYQSGHYSESRTNLATFMRLFPHSRLMPNALYWTGETWYAEQRFDKAIQAFAQVSSRYPRHEKSADALLKQAYSAIKSGDRRAARQLLDRLSSQYPGSRASTLGRRVLHEMQGRSEAFRLVTARG